jgi:hypothetical protein
MIFLTKEDYLRNANDRLFRIQSHLSRTTNLGTPKLWPLLTVGRCREVPLCPKSRKQDATMVFVVDLWSLFGGGR